MTWEIKRVMMIHKVVEKKKLKKKKGKKIRRFYWMGYVPDEDQLDMNGEYYLGDMYQLVLIILWIGTVIKLMMKDTFIQNGKGRMEKKKIVLMEF